MYRGFIRSLMHTLCTNAGQGSAADIPVAAHAQQAARLLDKLCALERQRCGNALLGCCLHHARLKTHLVHLGTLPRSAGHVRKTKLAFTPAEICFFVPHAVASAWRVQPTQASSRARALRTTKPEQRSTAALLHRWTELHLLVELCALERQRRGQALLGCCLRLARLGMRLGHLGSTARSSRAWHTRG